MSIEKAADKCINVLLELIQTKVNYVVQEAIIVIKVGHSEPSIQVWDGVSSVHIQTSEWAGEYVLWCVLFSAGHLPSLPQSV